MNGRTRYALLAALVACSVTASEAARADDKADCIATSEKAQSLRDDQKLLEAREQFLACARDVCPGAVKKDCADQVADLVKRTPSVVFRAKDKSGQDLVAVKVTADGKVLTEQLDGRAISLNPGVRAIRFEAAGNAPLDQKVVLAEGEHNRPVTAVLGTGVASAAAAEPSKPPSAGKQSAPVGAFAVGGIGIVSMGVAPIFYVMGLNQKSADEAPAGCKNTGGCSQSEIDSIRTKLIVGDVFMFAGAAILATGIVWTIIHYAGGHRESAAAPVAAIDVAPTAYGRGAVASTTIRW
ncbi:MAG TPA: hypothetical protein VLM85_10775 [Polyangiaceae bacterium]|nr:hypothetical protein [Polyangiaceae bacterium]